MVLGPIYSALKAASEDIYRKKYIILNFISAVGNVAVNSPRSLLGYMFPRLW